MKKIIIIEGLDNTGKSTLVSSLRDHYEKKGMRVFIDHSGKPDAGLSQNMSAIVQDAMFRCAAYKVPNKDDADVIILDRAWYGEYVYGRMYRERSKTAVVDMITDCELLVTRKYDNVCLIYMHADDSAFLVRNEDGKSLSGGDASKISLETSMFNAVYDLSRIKKHKITVNTGNKFREKQSILSEAVAFIEGIIE